MYTMSQRKTLCVIGVGSVMRLADMTPPGVAMRVFSRSYLSNGGAIGMVVVRRPSVVLPRAGDNTNDRVEASEI